MFGLGDFDDEEKAHLDPEPSGPGDEYSVWDMLAFVGAVAAGMLAIPVVVSWLF